MRRAGLIGVRSDEAEMWTPGYIEQVPGEAKRADPGQLRARVQSFAKDVRLGDLIVTPNKSRGEVWLSVVTGDYQFDPQPKIARYFHTRTVDWLGWLDHDAPWMKAQLKVIDQPLTVAELYNREWWWKHLDSKELSSAPRTKPSPRPTSSRPRASSASKPKPSPKPKPASPLLCAGSCGLQWSPYVLVDGLCPDCRGD